MSGESFDNICEISNNTRNGDNKLKYINYPSQVNTETVWEENNSSVFSQSKNEGKENQFNMSQPQLFDIFTDKKSIDNDIYNLPSDYPLDKQNIDSGNNCPVYSVSKNCNVEPEILNDQKNKNISEPKESRINGSQFLKIEKINGDNDNNYSPSDDNDSENKTKINKQNSLMDIEEYSYNLPSPDMNMKPNKVDLKSSNINNKAVEEDEKKKRKNKSDELRHTTVRKIIHLLNDDIVQPLFNVILEEENEKDYILELTISNKIISIQEELENFCNKSIIEICLIAKKANNGQAIKKNKEKIIGLLKNPKKKDNLYYKIFRILMDLRFIDIIKIYYDKAQINNILKRYSKTSEVLELENILANFGDFEKDFGNESNEIINKRKEVLRNFIYFSENKRKEKKIRFITS